MRTPVLEHLHRELLAHLHRAGWPTALAAARRPWTPRPDGGCGSCGSCRSG
ncbi:hypothetical protein [Kitasatospora sp. NPDC048407]|uniref:hypothetical protein n=1 Tax=Kitasatospora sp. NPDC048407 TaxID=3364051 RepID=UPI00371D8E60